MPVRLIMFDLDGTLVDTSRDITNALNHALQDYIPKIFTVEDTIQLIGEGITKLIEKVLGEGRVQERAVVIEKFLWYYSEHLTDNSAIYPHVRETLEKLSGYVKAVISNKREFLSSRLLEQLALLKYFDLVVGSDTATQKKPSPAPLLYVLGKLGVNPQDAFMVGDSNFDIEAGRKAGVWTVAVTYGYRSREYLTAADYIIDSFQELPLVLDRSSL